MCWFLFQLSDKNGQFDTYSITHELEIMEIIGILGTRSIVE
jgi:hypothetical protein